MKSIKSTVERTDEEEMLQILGEKSPVGICIIQDGKFCYFNSNFPIAIGYTADELVGKDPLELIVPEDREMVRENEIKMLNGELHSPYQFRVIHKDGSIRWVMEAVRSIRYHGRRAVLGSYMEVTERKQMEEALEESEEKYRELANSITNVFFAMDEHLRYTYWNRASEILTGIRAEDAIGKTLREIFPDKPWRRMAEKVYRSVLKTQQPQTFVNDYDIDGRHYVFEISAYPSRGGISVFVSDITERKQVIEALKQSEERYRTILEEMEDSYFEVDLGGHLTFVNSATCRKLGYSKEELIGMSYKKTILEDDIESVFRIFNKVYRTGKPNKSCLWTTVCKDGTHRLIEHSAFPLRNDKGEIIGFRGVGRDITERKQAEEKLQSSEERYRALFDSSVIGTLLLDAETMQILMGNEAAAKIFGFSSLEEGAGINVLDFVPQEDRELNRELIKKELFEQDSRQDYDVRAITKDGREIWINVTGVRMMRRGRLVGMVTFTDVTERKQAEEALKLLSSVTQQVSDATIITAADFNITYANKAAQDLFGYSPEEMLGKHMGTFNAEPLPKSREQELEQTLSSDKPWIGTLIKKRKDGSTFLCECRITPLHDDEGKISSYIDVMRDVTERKQAEEALRRSEERYRTILEEMEDSYFEVDLGGHLTFVNSATCRALGYSREELIGKSYKDYTAEEDIESVFQIFNEVYQTGVPNKGFAWKTIRKDGVQGFAETSVSPLRNDKGEIIGFRGVGRDVTERKQAEEALRQSEENYKTLFNSAVVGMYVMDAETMQVVMGNRAAREIIGFSSAEEGIGVNPFDFVVPEDREKVLEIAINEFFQDSRQTHEIRVMDKNGRKRWQSISIARIMHRGRLASLVSFTDITERKQMEEALRQSEENYRALFDSSVIGTFVLDAETMKVVMGNEAAMKLAGLDSPSEGIGINPFDFAIPEERERILEIVNKELFEQDLRRIHEFRAITKDGKKIWISITGARIMHGGKLAGLISFTDITERKRMEEALRQSEENYRALFDSSVIGTIVLDFETMQVVMANKAAVEAFSFSSVEEAIGVNPLDFIPSEDKERVSELITKDLFEQDLRTTQELRVITKDGREIWISATGARIMHEGKLAGLISFTDITEQKQQRERLMMTDRLASLGEMAAGTAHELNNPLTSIIGFSQLLMDREVPDDICDDLKIIYSEAQRAAKVTKDLLTFARKHAPMKQPNQINSIIDDVLQLRAHVQENRGIEVERHLAPDLPEIMVDYFQMQQVFLNIIINAEYFMTETHNKGTLTITTKNQNNSVIISFADDGPGIPLENLKRIFDPFFTTKEAGKGTGLGLSICHGIVIEHGGQIYVRSQLGKGATIFVELPIDSRDHIKRML